MIIFNSNHHDARKAHLIIDKGGCVLTVLFWLLLVTRSLKSFSHESKMWSDGLGFVLDPKSSHSSE